MDLVFYSLHSDTLCVLIGAFSPFIFRVIIDRYIFSATYFVVSGDFLCSFFFFVTSGVSFQLRVHFNISCRAGLVVMNSFSFCLGNCVFFYSE